MGDYILLVVLWALWCALHSLLISRPVTRAVQRASGRWAAYYRIVYNMVALLTLIPVAAYTIQLHGESVFRWTGPLRIVQAGLILAALFFFITGARRYDLLQFMGIRQAREQTTCSVLTDDCRLDTDGVLGMVRHPWYTGGILIVWARDLDTAGILVNLIISGYFIIGAMLEERKLRRQFGRAYDDYRRRVSMFLPIKWAMSRKPNR